MLEVSMLKTMLWALLQLIPIGVGSHFALRAVEHYPAIFRIYGNILECQLTAMVLKTLKILQRQ